MSTIYLDIAEDEKLLLLALQDLSMNASELFNKPTHLMDCITQFKSKHNFVVI